jgi:hypothetical protein
MGSHDPFEHLQHKLWQKKGQESKLAIWLPTTKSRESTWFPCVQVACDMPLESSRRELQLCFRPHPNQNYRNSNPGSFGTPLSKSWDKKPFGCGLRRKVQSILYGGRWWLPLNPGRGESYVSKCPWLVPTPKGVPNVN